MENIQEIDVSLLIVDLHELDCKSLVFSLCDFLLQARKQDGGGSRK